VNLFKGDKWVWQGISTSWWLHQLGLGLFVLVSQPSKGNNPAMEFTSVVSVKILVKAFSINTGAG